MVKKASKLSVRLLSLKCLRYTNRRKLQMEMLHFHHRNVPLEVLISCVQRLVPVCASFKTKYARNAEESVEITSRWKRQDVCLPPAVQTISVVGPLCGKSWYQLACPRKHLERDSQNLSSVNYLPDRLSTSFIDVMNGQRWRASLSLCDLSISGSIEFCDSRFCASFRPRRRSSARSRRSSLLKLE